MELKVENLTKSFGDVKALNHVSFTFTPGVYGILGPNGAGKSTLINLITGNIARQEGQILWNGREILKGGREYRKVLGYMPQQQGYYEDFTACAFLMYMAHLKGLDRRTAKSRSQELLQIFNLESARNKRIGGFSGGMKQRLLLAQALLNDPALLILDEPTAGVDPQERIHIRNYISQIATNRIVLLATHIVSDIEAIAKEIVLLKAGNVIEIDTPGRLIEKVRGYVWNVEIAEAELPDMQARYLISNLRKSEKGLSLKVINEDAPANAQPEKAVNLDDVYLYYIT